MKVIKSSLLALSFLSSIQASSNYLLNTGVYLGGKEKFAGASLGLNYRLFSGFHIGVKTGSCDQFKSLHFNPQVHIAIAKILYMETNLNIVPLIKGAFTKVQLEKTYYAPNFSLGISPHFKLKNNLSFGISGGVNLTPLIWNRFSKTKMNRGIVNLTLRFGWGGSALKKQKPQVGLPNLSTYEIRHYDDFDHVQQENPTKLNHKDPTIRLWVKDQGVKYIRGN